MSTARTRNPFAPSTCCADFTALSGLCFFPAASPIAGQDSGRSWSACGTVNPNRRWGSPEQTSVLADNGPYQVFSRAGRKDRND